MKEVFGLASLVVAFAGWGPYARSVLAGKTKPHAFSWLVWTVLSAISFAVQITHNGGPGAWLMALSALVTFAIFLLALKFGEKNILVVDWLSLTFAGVALLLWFITDRPLTSIILIATVDAVGGFFPTFRKSFKHPYEETVSLYFLYALSLIFSLAALKSFSLVNALYPASFVFINLSMVVFLLARRKVIKKPVSFD